MSHDQEETHLQEICAIEKKVVVLHVILVEIPATCMKTSFMCPRITFLSFMIILANTEDNIEYDESLMYNGPVGANRMRHIGGAMEA